VVRVSRLLQQSGPRTALVVEVPAAEPVVGRFRASYDPSAGQGVPAHVTVLYPWLPTGALDDATLRDLADVLAAVSSFDVRFASLQRFPQTLWVAPEPPDPFITLTWAVCARWPECPPYGGEFDSVIPHLTVADDVDVDSLAHVVTEVAPVLPIATRVETVTLLALDGTGRWNRHSTYPLG